MVDLHIFEIINTDQSSVVDTDPFETDPDPAFLL
jgi:hypothetical protein